MKSRERCGLDSFQAGERIRCSTPAKHIVNHVELDVHVGSIAVRRFIESRRPLLTLHGHIHESARITGTWRERIGSTFAFSARARRS